MIAKVQRWGNSQGIRFSKGVMEEAAIAVGDEVEVRVRRGAIVVRPARRVRGKVRLKDLLARMPAKHTPAEVDWGKPVGKEAW